MLCGCQAKSPLQGFGQCTSTNTPVLWNCLWNKPRRFYEKCKKDDAEQYDIMNAEGGIQLIYSSEMGSSQRMAPQQASNCACKYLAFPALESTTAWAFPVWGAMPVKLRRAPHLFLTPSSPYQTISNSLPCGQYLMHKTSSFHAGMVWSGAISGVVFPCRYMPLWMG
jgi:hypothetical protein